MNQMITTTKEKEQEKGLERTGTRTQSTISTKKASRKVKKRSLKVSKERDPEAGEQGHEEIA